MPFASIVFWAVFVIPLVVFLVWLMRQDKKKGVTGLVVLAVLIVVAVVYMYVMTKGE
jgi:amino acid permease